MCTFMQRSIISVLENLRYFDSLLNSISLILEA